MSTHPDNNDILSGAISVIPYMIKSLSIKRVIYSTKGVTLEVPLSVYATKLEVL